MLLKPAGIIAAATPSTPPPDPGTALDFGDGNSNTRYYTLGAFDLGSAWCIGCFTRIEENTGTGWQYLFNRNALGTPSVYLALRESGQSQSPNCWQLNMTGNDGVGTGLTIAASNPVADAAGVGDGIKRLMLIQSTGTAVQLWACELGETAALWINKATAINGITSAGVWEFGRRTDGASNRGFEEHARHLFFGSRILTQAEIEQIAAGASPVTTLGANALRHWPFFGPDETVLDTVGGNAATRQGTDWPAAVAW